MKRFCVICLLMFSVFSCAVAQEDGGEYSGSAVFLSPTKKDLIVVDYNSSEGGAFPYEATLYALPLGSGKGKRLEALASYEWAPDGSKFIGEDSLTREHWPIMKSRLVLYDKAGKELPLPVPVKGSGLYF